MPPHRFRLNQEILLSADKFRRFKGGPYRITMLYPNDEPDREYRVQNLADGHQRVVRESEILGRTEG